MSATAVVKLHLKRLLGDSVVRTMRHRVRGYRYVNNLPKLAVAFGTDKEGAHYVVEDLQTSYWDNMFGENWGGSSDLSASHTSMSFFKSLVDGLNYEEFTLKEYVPTYLDKHIISMHFYHNLLFVYKGENFEGSNMLGRRILG